MKLLDHMPAITGAGYRQAAFVGLCAFLAAGGAQAQTQPAHERAAGPVIAQAEQQPRPRRQEPARQENARQENARQETAPAQAGPRISEVAGRYAVLRDDGRDTLCMVTLQDTARGAGYYRAQLAPACRDNGIVVFDPVAWSVDRAGHISLQARKGHKIQFQKNAKGDWYRIDDKSKPLGLRKI